MELRVEEYLSSWNGRLRSSLLDVLILKESAHNPNPVYAYSITKQLQELWGEDKAPPMPTVYSVIKRLEENRFIEFSQEIIGGRVQKKLLITGKGYDLLELMKQELENYKNDIIQLREGIL